jgi:energy-coupling factor transport system permease protein
VVPVLEDALDRSLTMAAGMDTRGYGRSGDASASQRRRTGALLILGLLGLCVGCYGALDPTAPGWLAAPMLVAGLALAVAGLGSAGRNVARTRYRPDPWGLPEWWVATTGLVPAAAAWWVGRHELLLAYPGLDSWPQLSAVTLAAAAVGLAVVLVAPVPPSSEPQYAVEEVSA